MMMRRDICCSLIFIVLVVHHAHALFSLDRTISSREKNNARKLLRQNGGSSGVYEINMLTKEKVDDQHSGDDSDDILLGEIVSPVVDDDNNDKDVKESGSSDNGNNNLVKGNDDKASDNIAEVNQGRNDRPENLRQRFRRAASSSSPGQPISFSFELNDSHTNALISWAGDTPHIVALTKTPGTSRRSNLYTSDDYGKSFVNVVRSNRDCLCIRSANKNASFDNLYHAQAVQKTRASAKSYIFTDSTNKLITITRDLLNFTTVSVDFHPASVVFHPVREDVVVAYGSRSSYSGARKNLYVSFNFGLTWSIAKSNVEDFQWGWQPDQVFVLVPTFFGLRLYDVKELTYDDGIQERTIISNVQGFELQGSFLFATKRYSLFNTSSPLNLFVSKNGSRFVQADFPVIPHHPALEYYIVDAEIDRVMMCVLHGAKSAHLYVSDVSGSKYTLSLPNIVYISPHSVLGTSFPGLRYYSEPFADVHKVAGLRGIYIASQFLANGTTPSTRTNTSQTTRITYDKGGQWTHITAPYRDMHGHHTHCYWYLGCTLHLLQDFLFNPSYRSEPILSSANAAGLVIGSGVLGKSLSKQSSPSIFLSVDAGFNWREVARGNYTYNFGDHGNLIVLVPSRKLTKDLYYSYNEGASWHQYTFTSSNLRIYGLLTEPGSATGNFSIWGSKPGAHSWVIVHLNLIEIFGGVRCNASQYKMWSPGVMQTHKDTCLLGEQEVIERKNPWAFCFNGRHYERTTISRYCKCVRADYECDYGYISQNETEDIWSTEPHYQSLSTVPCVRDPDVSDVVTSKPDFCPFGTNYIVTKGYRRIPGDKCDGGRDHFYDPIHRSCPPDNKTDFIIYTIGSTVYKLDMDSKRSEILINTSASNEIYSVEFDYNRDLLFWADEGADTIMYYNLSDPYPTQQTLFYGNTGKVECISLDWESDNIYLLDSRTPKIEIFTLLTHWRRTIVSNNQSRVLENPRALEVFPSHGLMFWTDWSASNPRIMKAAMTGANITILIDRSNSSGHLHWPNGMTVDFDAELVYIIDGYTHKILSCHLDGSSLNTLLYNSWQIKHPFALTMLKDRLYWSDWADNKLKSVYKANGYGYDVIVSNNGSRRIMNIKAMSWDDQYVAKDTGCGDSDSTNGGCSNICVPHPLPNVTKSTNRVCLCPDATKPNGSIDGLSERYCQCHYSGQKFNVTTGVCEWQGHSIHCQSDQFACAHGRQCIPKRWQCDHDDDCSDNSDETNCDSNICASDEFLCKHSQRCISKDWLCDGDNDCGDSADEQNCNTTCPSNQFRCANGRCLPHSDVCDDEYDCGNYDYSDEVNCTTTAPACNTTTHFECNATRYSTSCIPIHWKCDGDYDCDDRSDEWGCTTTCSSFQFKCATRDHCIPNSWLCDGDNDCGDHSDEQNCTRTTTTSRTTTPTCFCRDRYRNCVTYAAVCDGYIDCSDGRDEWGCRVTTTTPPTTTNYPCYGFRCLTGLCISSHMVCDGHYDCPYREDETNCRRNCTYPQVPCAASLHECIDQSRLCDGVSDCVGGTDELGCAHGSTTTSAAHCSPLEFGCNSSKQCIDQSKVCDNRWDCYGGEDELNCDFNVTISNFSLTKKTATNATFIWTPNSVHGVTGSVTYVVQYGYVSDIHNTQHTPWIKSSPVNGTSMTVTGLEPYSNYIFTVHSVVSGKPGKSSNAIHMSTDAAPPGNVSHITAHLLDGEFDDVNEWVISWNYPSRPNGKITGYIYSVVSDKRVNQTHFVAAHGTDAMTVRVTIPMYKKNSIMTISVFAINEAGRGSTSKVIHCLQLPKPQLSCDASQANSVHITASLDKVLVRGTSDLRILVMYTDVDGLPRHIRQPTSRNISASYNLTLAHLSSAAPHTIRAELEMGTTGTICVSPAFVINCTTNGPPGVNVVGLKVGKNISTTSIPLSWTGSTSVTQYRVELAMNLHGDPNHTFLSNSSHLTATGLENCQTYYIRVREFKPVEGPASAPVSAATLANVTSGPRMVQAFKISSTDTGLYAVFNLNDTSDLVQCKIKWRESCVHKEEKFIVYIRERNHDYINDKKMTVRNESTDQDGSLYITVWLERGGTYELTVQEGKNSVNSSTITYHPDPYRKPIIQLYRNDDNIMYKLSTEYDGWDYSRYSNGHVMVDIQYSENGGPQIDVGEVEMKGTEGSCPIPSITASSNYTVYIRFARKYQGRYYYGNFGNASILATAASRTSPHSSHAGEYAGIAIGALVVVVLAVLLSVWCVRHRRLQRSFLDFTSSHYNTRTDNATFSNDEDSPMIQGFSDDEPLVIA